MHRISRSWKLLAGLVVVAAVATSAALVGTVRAAAEANPVNTSPPTVNGVLTQGQTLTANPGSWNGNGPFTFAYQWNNCTAANGGCVPIAGATSQTYTLQAGDADKWILVQVTAIDTNGAAGLQNSDETADTVEGTPVGLTSPPKNLVAPSIGGNLLQGSTLTAFVGQWSGNPVPDFNYQWSRCNPSGVSCNPIPGATSSTYVLQAADVASTIAVTVTGFNSTPPGTASQQSSPTSIVKVPVGPVNTAVPTITGSAAQGQTLTATNGTWTGAPPITYAYQWLRCNAQGLSCAPISGATAQTYVAQAADVGNQLAVTVTAKDASGGTTPANSKTTATVTGGGPTPPPNGQTIPVSQVSLPNRLVVTGVDFTPNVLSSRAPFQARFRVSDSEGHFVSGAQVFLSAIPFGRVAPAPIQATDQNGFATFTLRPTAKFPLTKGFLITIFVRATKPGAPILGNVSSRRLVSVHINPR